MFYSCAFPFCPLIYVGGLLFLPSKNNKPVPVPFGLKWNYLVNVNKNILKEVRQREIGFREISNYADFGGKCFRRRLTDRKTRAVVLSFDNRVLSEWSGCNHPSTGLITCQSSAHSTPATPLSFALTTRL